MISAIAASQGHNLTINDGNHPKGGILYTAPGASIGFGVRSDPNMSMPVWTPAPGTYDTRKDANANSAPKFK